MKALTPSRGENLIITEYNEDELLTIEVNKKPNKINAPDTGEI